jgi:DNA-binding PadR family transcriptional regulator
MKELSKIEELFLLTIWRLKEDAYGVTIRRSIIKTSGKQYTYGTIYGILDQLLNKGYVTKKEGEPSGVRGGRRKLLYNLSPFGIEALKISYEMQRIVWGTTTGESFETEYNK